MKKSTQSLLALSSAMMAVACTATDVDDTPLYNGSKPDKEDTDKDPDKEPSTDPDKEPDDHYTPSYDGDKYNVLFLMADDFNYWASCLGYYPDAKTPNIDKLAESGVLFSRAFCSSPVSNPSRNSLWSGVRPSTSGIDQNSEDGYIRNVEGFEDVVTMNQYFMQNGYHVYGAGKLYHPGSMGSDHTDPANWSEMNKCGTGSKSTGGNFVEWTNPGWGTMSYKVGKDKVSKDNCDDYSMALDVVDYIKKYPTSKNADKPFFLGCGFFRPHLPWNISKQMWDLVDGGTFGIPKGYSDTDMNNNDTNSEHIGVLNANKWSEAIRVYLSAMALADYNVGLVMDALNDSPYKDNTIVVFVGDHGWHLGEKKNWGKNTIYNEANHTTLIIRYPGTENSISMTCDKAVSLQDLYPTLIDLCNLPQKPDVEGTNITQLVMDPDYSQWYTPVLSTYRGTSYVQDNDYKYVENQAFYDLKADPFEWNNIYNKNTQIKSLQAKYQAKMDSIRAFGTNLRKTRGLSALTRTTTDFTLTEENYPAPMVEKWHGKSFSTIEFDSEKLKRGVISHDMLCFEALAHLYLYNSEGKLLEDSQVYGELDLDYRIKSQINKGTYYAVIEDGGNYTISTLNY